MDGQVSAVDMLETKVQEMLTVVEDLDNGLTKLEDDLELRVDEIASPYWMVLRSIRFWHVLSRTWSNGVTRSRIVTFDLFMIESRIWSIACLEGCTASPGRYTNTGQW